ncbi:MAG TPA: diguanylate cyclase [Pyrinomonadaceae bacterium]|jgi:diguanylate cyclase (GGDEF)-like protein
MNAATEKKKNVAANRARGRVLLVTDDDLSSLIQTLSKRQIEVVGVSTGTAALVSLQRSRPHLVIANPNARGLGVEELSRMLSKSEDGIPLVLAGAEPATTERRYEALRSGAFDYFQLPIESELLIERIQQLVSLRQKMDDLRAHADLDHLTGLANRRRFRVALQQEVERWRRYGVPCALLLIDIDHLKKINDKFGHPAGDAVIREIAQTLKEVSRDNDTPARMGGEEFALLLAGINGQKAAAAADRLRDFLRRRTVEGVGTVTVSIGVAACPDSANSERALYSAGDGALYVAKNGGRDRVAVAPLLQENLPGV